MMEGSSGRLYVPRPSYDAGGDEEKTSLLADDGLPPYATTRATWMRFCACFGIMHGCAVTSMAYASSVQGAHMSSVTLSAFFGAYTLSALFLATNVVRRLGVLLAMLTGFAGYVLLSASYVSYDVVGGGLGADIFVVAASLAAGAGGAVLWVAQTAQYATAAAAYAEVQSMDRADAAAEFAGLFATIYVSTEAAVKVATALTLFGGASLTAAIGALMCVGAVATAAFLADPLAVGLGFRTGNARRSRGAAETPWADARGARAVVAAHAAEPRLWCLAPLTLGFGFSSALFTDWIDHVVDKERGPAAVAAVSAITTLTAGVACLPLNKLYRLGGARAPVGLAAASYAALGASLLALGSLEKLTKTANLVAIFALQGLIRAVFENSTKFIFLDAFVASPNLDAALASIYAHSGFASTVTYALLFSGNVAGAGATLLAFGAAIAAGFYAAERHGPKAAPDAKEGGKTHRLPHQRHTPAGPIISAS